MAGIMEMDCPPHVNVSVSRMGNREFIWNSTLRPLIGDY